MSWVREKLEKKHINNETHSTGKGKKEKEKPFKKKYSTTEKKIKCEQNS